MQKLKRSYEDSRAAHRNLGKINTELQDVHRIMFKNIDDVLDRGSALDCGSQPSDHVVRLNAADTNSATQP